MRASEGAEARPAVDVVVPFHGSSQELADLRARLAKLRLRDGDSAGEPIRFGGTTRGRPVVIPSPARLLFPENSASWRRCVR